LEPRELFHNDRIIVGTNTSFIFKYPGKESESPNAEKIKDIEIDWEYAQTELVDTMNKEKKLKIDEMEKERKKDGKLFRKLVHLLVESKIKNIEEKFQSEKSENETMIQKQKEEYEKKIRELEQRMKKVISVKILKNI
jgi:hypothetical protein